MGCALKLRSEVFLLIHFVLTQSRNHEPLSKELVTWCLINWVNQKISQYSSSSLDVPLKRHKKNWWVSQYNFLLFWSKKYDVQNWIFSEQWSTIGPQLFSFLSPISFVISFFLTIFCLSFFIFLCSFFLHSLLVVSSVFF